MISVMIGLSLRRYTAGAGRVMLEGETLESLESCLAALEARFPDLCPELREPSGALNPDVVFYVNHQDVRFLDWMATPLRDGDEVSILRPVAGGTEVVANRGGMERDPGRRCRARPGWGGLREERVGTTTTPRGTKR